MNEFLSKTTSKRKSDYVMNSFTNVNSRESSSSSWSLKSEISLNNLPGSINDEPEIVSATIKTPRTRQFNPYAEVTSTRRDNRPAPFDHFLVKETTRMLNLSEIAGLDYDLVVALPSQTKIPKIRLVEIEVDVKTVKDQTYKSV